MTPTWKVRTRKGGGVMLSVFGPEPDQLQEFGIEVGSNSRWMARMLRKAMRKVARGSERKKA